MTGAATTEKATKRLLPTDKATLGYLNGALGMLIFSASLPATRVAVQGFDPVFLTTARAAIAGLLALGVLLLLKIARPGRGDLVSLVVIALGVVVGFPLLTALALQHITSAQSLVFIGLLPLSTAVFGVLRGAERPKPVFWLFSLAGSLIVVGFAVTNGGPASLTGDLLMIAAILVCGLGYAEGGRLTRQMGGFAVIAWALVLALPVMLVLTVLLRPETFAGVTAGEWLGLAYVSLFSMLIGFVFWYRGLALGGIAAVGQLQLLQPFFGLALAALLLGERVSWGMGLATLAVVACVAGARRYGR
ncbi:DMT family transporter [Rhizobium glycinendophyticum]|uniref:DMT family transporter n=1 Tax=Rhizobium glycinendophyticum TaxID=2589807 RepID=A0A504V4B7_9HYPH|nr:DMT family transporter [Rhizobium glycinendophyticum]TPP12153.1 DMT family transporter [Rhizobium glycinendophyticum]